MTATLQTMSITVVNLQDNRAVFRIFIALLRFSFDSPSDNELVGHEFETPNAEHAIEMQNLFHLY
jgi:hypothetical protein